MKTYYHSWCLLPLVFLMKGGKADTSSLNNYGRFGPNNGGGGGGGHAGGVNGAHDTGNVGSHNEPQSQYSGVLPPVTLGGGGGGLNQYTAGAGTGGGGDAGAPAPEYFGTAESDYYDDYSTDVGNNGNGNAKAGEDGAGEDGSGSLEDSIPGVPGTDYPIYADIPETGFTCEDKVAGGYYADPEGECQVFHICAGGPAGELFKFNFLCPNGTIFNQEFFICDWWFNFDCAEAEEFYSKNDDNAAAAAAVDEAAAQAKAADQGAAEGDSQGDAAESPTGERSNQKGYSSPTGGRKGGGNGGSNGGSRRGGNGGAGGRRPKPQTGYGAPSGDEGLPPLASYGK